MLIRTLAIATLALAAVSASAQNYPTKPIRIHTAGAGGVADVVGRLVAAELSTALGQQVLIENKAGSVLVGGVAKSPPDGYTLLLTGGPLWLAPLLEDTPYGLPDFAPISTLVRSPYILVAHPSLGAKTVAELIKVAKSRPGQLNYSSGSTGSGSHLTGELFKSLAGVDVVRIAYKNQPQETADVLSGHVHMTFGSGATWEPQVKAGKLIALATAGVRRSVLFPDLPSVNETLPGFVSEQLLGLWAPVKTPPAIVRRLSDETTKLLDKPDVRQRLQASGQETVGGTPEQLADIVKAEVARLGKVIKDNNIRRE